MKKIFEVYDDNFSEQHLKKLIRICMLAIKKCFNKKLPLTAFVYFYVMRVNGKLIKRSRQACHVYNNGPL